VREEEKRFFHFSFFFFFRFRLFLRFRKKNSPLFPLSLSLSPSSKPKYFNPHPLRCVATARVLMPRSVVRLSAGRKELGLGDQALAFLAGANSIFDGDKLLTTKNADREDDDAMFAALGLRPRPAFVPYAAGGESSRGGAEGVQVQQQQKA